AQRKNWGARCANSGGSRQSASNRKYNPRLHSRKAQRGCLKCGNGSRCRFHVNILYVESSRSWGGQEHRTCLEINWLNAHGHQAWLICNPDSQVHSKASELGTRLVTMPLGSRVDLVCSWRVLGVCP